MTSSQSYAHAFGILSASAVGVILTHTREPDRVTEALRAWAFTQDVPRQYAEWDCLRGWALSKNTDDPKKEQIFDKIGSLLPALKKVGDVDNNGSNMMKNTVAAMVYPQWELCKIAQAIQCVKLYAQTFPEGRTRLILIVPEGFQLPRELENDVVVLDMGLPTVEELGEIFDKEIKAACEARRVKNANFTPDDRKELLAIGSGMTVTEFSTSVARAYATHRDVFPKVSVGDFGAVIQGAKTEVVNRSEVLELVAPKSIDELGGLDLFKEWAMEVAQCFSPAARAFGCAPPKGCALFGPPGTAKSIACQAIAYLFRLRLIRFDIAKIFNKMIGGSEERVAAAIKLLKAMAPVVAWIDEVDKGGIDPRQASGDSGVGKRAMGSLLTAMAEEDTGIFWIVSANRIAGVPSEFLRPGRLDEIFSFLPPNPDEREAIFRIHLLKWNQDPAKVANLSLAVAKSEGYVGAEIEQVCKDAVRRAYLSGKPVTGESLVDQLGTRKPIAVAFAADFNEMKEWAQNNARPASILAPGALARSRPRRSLEG